MDVWLPQEPPQEQLQLAKALGAEVVSMTEIS